MVRHVNASFVGTLVGDVDVDAPTFKRVVEDVVGDVALTYDKLTGENGILASDTVIHNGATGRGCPLGLPLVNQLINADMRISDPTSKDQHGGLGEHVFAPYVVMLQPGETEIVVFASISSPNTTIPEVGGAYVRVLSTALVEEAVEPFIFFNSGLDMACRVTGLVAGLHLVFPILRSDLVGAAGAECDLGVLRCVSIHHGRMRDPRALAARRGADYGVWEPSATEGVVHRDLDVGFFGETQAIDGYIMATVNRNMNGLEEFIRGWPAGGNFAFVHEDHDNAGAPDAINPRRSRFDAHTHSGIEFATPLFTDEPEIAFSLMAASCGSFIFVPGTSGAKFAVELANPPTFGLTDWFTPWQTAEASQSVTRAYAMVPDFNTLDSKLKMTALILSDASADVANYEVTTTANGNSSAAVTPTNIDGGANNFWLATNIEVPFDPDIPNEFSIDIERVTGSIAAPGEAAIVAFALYFEP